MSTSVLAGDTASIPRYKPSQRFIHWLMALVILSAVGLGYYSSLLAPGTPIRVQLLTLHKSLGLTALVLIVLRIPLRLSYGEPAYKKPLSHFNHLAARLAHLALYALMVLMPVSGYITSAAGGRDLVWFGLFTWPNIMPLDKELQHLAGEVHEYGAYAIYLCLAVHILAALYHHFVLRDEIMKRMV